MILELMFIPRGVDEAAKNSQGIKRSLFDPHVELYVDVLREGLATIFPCFSPKNVVVIGAGLAGLSAASTLKNVC